MLLVELGREHAAHSEFERPNAEAGHRCSLTLRHLNGLLLVAGVEARALPGILRAADEDVFVSI